MSFELKTFISLLISLLYLFVSVKCGSNQINPIIANELNFRKVENLITLFSVVNNVETKIRSGKLDEINFFEKWIIELLVKRSRAINNQLYSDQKTFWTFRQG